MIGPGWNVKVAFDSLEVLVRSGKVPPQTFDHVLEVLRRHQQQAIAACHATLEHRFPGTRDTEEDDRRTRSRR